MLDTLSKTSDFVRTEAQALSRLADRLDTHMRVALDDTLALLAVRTEEGHRTAVTGVGKSGIIARKIAATLNSTGTGAYFLHPVEAMHGDIGMLRRGDAVIVLSYSGETEEILRLLPTFARLELSIISLTGCQSSTLASVSTITLDVSVDEEACDLNLAPTASTTVMLALGDAIALELSRRAGFQPQNFADLHPGGLLGRKLARVRDLMHTGEALPQVSPSTPFPQVMHEMSRKKLGMTTVVTSEPGRDRSPNLQLAGIISDGDLRRLMERLGPQAFQRSAGDIMNRAPQTIAPTAFASEALARMESNKITSLVVVEEQSVLGVVHLHDLWQPDDERQPAGGDDRHGG